MVKLLDAEDCPCDICDGGVRVGKDDKGNPLFGGSLCVCQCHRKESPMPTNERRDAEEVAKQLRDQFDAGVEVGRREAYFRAAAVCHSNCSWTSEKEIRALAQEEK